MSASGNNPGTSASDPISLLSSSSEGQSAPRTASGPSTQPREGASVTERGTRHIAPRPRPKREPDSSEGDTDSDLSVRRTRAFRGRSSGRSSSSSAHGSSQFDSRPAGTPSNPVFVGEPAGPQAPQPRQSRSRATHELAAQVRRSYLAGNSLATLPSAAQTSQTMSRRPSGPTLSTAAPAHPRLTRLPSVVLPRWQPDAEVTYCPICHTQFSFFIRKHHCRLVSPDTALFRLPDDVLTRSVPENVVVSSATPARRTASRYHTSTSSSRPARRAYLAANTPPR